MLLNLRFLSQKYERKLLIWCIQIIFEKILLAKSTIIKYIFIIYNYLPSNLPILIEERDSRLLQRFLILLMTSCFHQRSTILLQSNYGSKFKNLIKTDCNSYVCILSNSFSCKITFFRINCPINHFSIFSVKLFWVSFVGNVLRIHFGPNYRGMSFM